MITIGMLHHRKDPRTVIKSFAYAAVAKAQGAELLYFTPRAVDFKLKKIHGYVYENGSWQKTEVPFPNVIYNTGSPDKLSRSGEIISKLKEEIPFTTNSIGHKMKVYDRLKNAGEFAQYLIPSEYIHSVKRFFDFIDIYRKIIFKPVNGRQGRDITFIERVGNRFHLLIGKKDYDYNWHELRDYVHIKLQEEPHLVQPYINCKTKSGHAYDFRLHVQKNGEGQWIITKVYPRIAPDGSIVSNISSGGSTNYLEPFLKQEFGEEYFEIKRYLEHFSLQLAAHLDKLQQDYYAETIDELGIDVALDDLRKIWIYEVNWRPGSPPSFYLELDVVKKMVDYAIFLAKEHQAKHSS